MAVDSSTAARRTIRRALPPVRKALPTADRGRWLSRKAAIVLRCAIENRI
jgi:hypothetical protein